MSNVGAPETFHDLLYIVESIIVEEGCIKFNDSSQMQRVVKFFHPPVIGVESSLTYSEQEIL